MTTSQFFHCLRLRFDMGFEIYESAEGGIVVKGKLNMPGDTMFGVIHAEICGDDLTMVGERLLAVIDKQIAELKCRVDA